MNRKFALTVSPKDRVDKYNKIEHIYIDDVNIMRKYMKRCSSHYIVYPETDAVGRLHYHGIIEVSDKIKFVKQVIPALKRIGYVCLKPLDTLKDNISWILYCSKEWMITKDIVDIQQPLIPQHKKKIIKDRNTDYVSLLDYGFHVIA